MPERRDLTLGALGRLIGTWEVHVVLGGKRMGSGTASFEWIEGRGSLLQRSSMPAETMPEEWVGHAPTSVVTVMGFDDMTGRMMQLYTDDRGVNRVYDMSLDKGTWKLWRQAPGFDQRFSGTISEDANAITAFWDVSTDGKTWERDFDLLYTRR